MSFLIAGVGPSSVVYSRQAQQFNGISYVGPCDPHVLARLEINHPIAGVVVCFKQPTNDPQYGYSTTDSSSSSGVQDEETANQPIVSNGIGVGNGFTDNLGNWLHIGIGDNTGGSSCTNPPVIWGEYAISGTYYELPLVCGSYGSTYQLTVIADDQQGHWYWDYFIGTTNYASWYVGLNSIGVGSNGNAEFIETTSVPCLSGGWQTVYQHAFKYATMPLSPSGLGSTPFSTASSSSISSYNNNWSTSCWSETLSSSAPWSISYDLI